MSEHLINRSSEWTSEHLIIWVNIGLWDRLNIKMNIRASKWAHVIGNENYKSGWKIGQLSCDDEWTSDRQNICGRLPDWETVSIMIKSAIFDILNLKIKEKGSIAFTMMKLEPVIGTIVFEIGHLTAPWIGQDKRSDQVSKFVRHLSKFYNFCSKIHDKTSGDWWSNVFMLRVN